MVSNSQQSSISLDLVSLGYYISLQPDQMATGVPWGLAQGHPLNQQIPLQCCGTTIQTTGACFNKKDCLSRYLYSHYKDKTVTILSYLYNWTWVTYISYSDNKMAWWSMAKYNMVKSKMAYSLIHRYRDSHGKEKWNCLIFIMGFPIMVKQHLQTKTTPSQSPHNILKHTQNHPVNWKSIYGHCHPTPNPIWTKFCRHSS